MTEEAKKGIENLKFVISTAKELVVDIIVNAKDGISFEDLKVLKDNYEKVIGAVKVFKELPSEVADLDFAEIKELVSEGMNFVLDIVEAIKTPVVK